MKIDKTSKIVKLSFKVNSLKSTLRFLQENLNFDILNHYEYRNPIRYSITEVGFSENENFKIELDVSVDNNMLFVFSI